jgi:DNA-binding transcriptional regulator YdaS (Cro superfamily)
MRAWIVDIDESCTREKCQSSPEELARQEKLVYVIGMETEVTTVPREPIGAAALEKALIISGGLITLAKSLGLSYQNVQCWRVKTRKFATPAAYVLDVERLTGVSRHELRPDVFGEAE